MAKVPMWPSTPRSHRQWVVSVAAQKGLWERWQFHSSPLVCRFRSPARSSEEKEVFAQRWLETHRCEVFAAPSSPTTSRMAMGFSLWTHDKMMISRFEWWGSCWQTRDTTSCRSDYDETGKVSAYHAEGGCGVLQQGCGRGFGEMEWCRPQNTSHLHDEDGIIRRRWPGWSTWRTIWWTMWRRRTMSWTSSTTRWNYAWWKKKNKKPMKRTMWRPHNKENTSMETLAFCWLRRSPTRRHQLKLRSCRRCQKFSHVHYDETDKEPCGQQDQGGEAVQSPLEQFHTEEDFPPYTGDIYPDDVEINLAKKYRAMPEEYYTRSGLRPITPKNFRKWFNQAKGKKLRWHFWEIFSGSGRLSLIMLLAGLTVGFPIDMRLWMEHQQPPSTRACWRKREMSFCPGVVFMAPECGPWSVFIFVEETWGSTSR